MRLLPALLLALVLALVTGCTGAGAAPERTGPPPDPARAMRFAALAPMPAGGSVVRLESQDGIDTAVTLTVRLPVAAVTPWLRASGVTSLGGQQRVANLDGAIVYRTATVAGTDVTITAFTT